MSIVVKCQCGRLLKARADFAGTRAVCPSCGRTVDVAPDAAVAPADLHSAGLSSPLWVKEFLDPPQASPQTDAGAGGLKSGVERLHSPQLQVFVALAQRTGQGESSAAPIATRWT